MDNNGKTEDNAARHPFDDRIRSLLAEMGEEKYGDTAGNKKDEGAAAKDIDKSDTVAVSPSPAEEEEGAGGGDNGISIEEIEADVDGYTPDGGPDGGMRNTTMGGGGFNPFGVGGVSSNGVPGRRRRLEPDVHFDPELLNIVGGYSVLKKNIDAYIDWCGKHPKENQGFSFLFTGMPGTGKTQLGRHIAGLLKRKLLVKRMSDIMNCFVGETEKNIAEAFNEAYANKYVLMIDEADSLFYSRSNSRTSWEVSATNEVLSQLEDFDGVFIATTNLLNNFDSAAMRRFDWKVQFLPCTPEARIKLFEAYFDRKITESSANVLLDSRFNLLCPGDFKAVWRKLRFQDDKTDKLILASLLTEVKYKQIKPSQPVY